MRFLRLDSISPIAGKACDWLQNEFWMSSATGLWRPGLRPAAGPFSTTMPITPTLMIRRSWSWPWTGWTPINIAQPLIVPSWMGRVSIPKMVAGRAHSMRTTHTYLNHIPFADHGALLDYLSADVTARCLSMLAQLGYKDRTAVKKALAYLRAERAGRKAVGSGGGARIIFTGRGIGFCAPLML